MDTTEKLRSESPIEIRPLIEAYRKHLRLVEGYADSNGYHRMAGVFLRFCVGRALPLQEATIQTYELDKPPAYSTALWSFWSYYTGLGKPLVVVDPPKASQQYLSNGFIQGYLTDARVQLRDEESLGTYRQALRQFYRYLGQEWSLSPTVPPSVTYVRHYLDWMQQKGLSATTQNTALSVIRRFSEWCLAHQVELKLQDEELSAIYSIRNIPNRPVSPNPGFKESLSSHQRMQLMEGRLAPRDVAILSLLAYEGILTVELCRIRLKDLNFANSRIQIIGRDGVSYESIKFFQLCQEALRCYLVATTGWPIDPERGESYLFCNADGTALKPYQIRYVVDKALGRLGLKGQGFSTRNLRHTAGQLLIAQHVSVDSVHHHLRNQSYDMTLRYRSNIVRERIFEHGFKLPELSE